MENNSNQEADENPYVCFQRTPSLRRKWRKRYGGLDGNKLLDPNEGDDMRDNGVMTEGIPGRNAGPERSAEVEKSSLSGNISGNIPHVVPRSVRLSPRSVNLTSPGSTGVPAFCSNGVKALSLPADPEQALSPQPWPMISRTETLNSQSHKKVAADVLFDSFASGGRVSTDRMFETLWSCGILRTDPRIKGCYALMRKLQDADGAVSRSTFHRCVTGFVSFILKALQGRFVLPDFSTFTEETQKLFTKCKQLSSVKEKEEGNENAGTWGVSICTVDGQRLSLGDWAEPCVLGEVCWALVYGLAVDQLGVDYVHRYVGVDEYAKYESPFTLNKQGVPHSPLTETGAIVSASLLQLTVRPVTEEEEKYESVLNIVRRLCNKEHANLNCTSYQRLRKDIIRLHALSFYLQEKKCFPEGVDINATLDLLLQCLSTEVTCASGAVMAATFANGGLCPMSGDQVLSPSAVRSALSLMQVAGLNDYSRVFHFKTSVPAKSSSSGVVLAVIPGVLGLTCWSPELDAHGNSWRGVHFCEALVSGFQLHSFDIRTPFRQALSYRQWKVESEGYQIMNVLLAAYRGDVHSLRRYFLSGADVNAVDYDGRTALHVAASEGRLEVVGFLVENAGADCMLKDRWGNTALQEALRCNQGPAAHLLKKFTNYEESL
ncbi:glutaminase liver isoform, mitochondrial isoform X2 [Brachyhypopomus gauderio]|uniref:glutaminase liver isoform, mitochondrial isoform X2 n=1 Tax=Brachyhypopomus gauderio TaxID=698409 RepID=UPI0040431CA7